VAHFSGETAQNGTVGHNGCDRLHVRYAHQPLFDGFIGAFLMANKQGSRGSGRGFASMDPQRQREIASQGGRAAHASGNAHEFTSEEARAAGARSHSRQQQQGNANRQQSGNRQQQQQQPGNERTTRPQTSGNKKQQQQ